MSGDLLNPNKNLEIVGTWTWAMDADDVGVAGVMGNVQNVVRNALNTIVASGNVPEDPNVLVAALLGDFGDAFNLIAGALFSSIPGIPDDAVGSRFYIGVGAKGALSNIVDAAVPTTCSRRLRSRLSRSRLISTAVRSSRSATTTASPARCSPRGTAATTTTCPWSTWPPAQGACGELHSVRHLGRTRTRRSARRRRSNDPDGTIVSYNWNFGDFTTGSGTLTSHTFNTAGTFPVTLTVTDNSGMSHSTTTNIAIGGAPTVAPSGPDQDRFGVLQHLRRFRVEHGAGSNRVRDQHGRLLRRWVPDRSRSGDQRSGPNGPGPGGRAVPRIQVRREHQGPGEWSVGSLATQPTHHSLRVRAASAVL